MIDALVTGKLIRDPELKTSQSGNKYTNILLSVSIGEAENIVISAIAFGAHAERLCRLAKGDALAVAGSLKPTEWADKATSGVRHGLSITVNQVLSLYDIQKKRKKPAADKPQPQHDGYYNDEIPI